MVDQYPLKIRKTPELQIGILKNLINEQLTQKELIEQLTKDRTFKHVFLKRSTKKQQEKDHDNKKKSVSRAVGILIEKNLIKEFPESKNPTGKIIKLRLTENGFSILLNLALYDQNILSDEQLQQLFKNIKKESIIEVLHKYAENNISERIINPLSSSKMLDVLKRIYNKIGNDKNQLECVKRILQYYVDSDIHKIKELYDRVQYLDDLDEEITNMDFEQVGQKDKIKQSILLQRIKKLQAKFEDQHTKNPDIRLFGMLQDEKLIYTLDVDGKTEQRISIFGILFLISNLDDNEIKDIIKHEHIKSELPLVFGGSLWSNIEQLFVCVHTKNGVQDTLIKPFRDDFGRVFNDSAYWPRMNHLNQLYNTEPKAYRKLKELTDSGLKILRNLAEIENCGGEFFDYLNNGEQLPKPLEKYMTLCSKLRKYYLTTKLYYEDYEDIHDLSLEENPIRELIQESITFHFYSYLENLPQKRGYNLEWRDYYQRWNKFLEHHKNINNFLEEWRTEIDNYAKTTETKNMENTVAA